MSILETLRAQQKAAGVTADPNEDGETAYIESLQPGQREFDDAARRSKPNPAYVPAPYREYGGTLKGGYCRLLPPQFVSIASATPEWLAANWAEGVPSPWQSVEGMPNHPDFEKNFAAFEKSPCE